MNTTLPSGPACLALVLAAHPALADNEFHKGCARAATEVLCAGHDDCEIRSLTDRSKSGDDSERGGDSECRTAAKAALSQGMSADGKRAVGRLKDQLARLNKGLAKDFPFVKVTADFKRLELEDVVVTARGLSEGKPGGRAARSAAVALSPDDTATGFERSYLNPIKTALYNAGRDDLGMAFMRGRLKEVRLLFCTAGGTCESPRLKTDRGVLLVPGIYPLDSSGYAAAVQEYLEKSL